MRGAFLGPFGVRSYDPPRSYFTRGLAPLWCVENVSWPEIAAWCYRVKEWKVVVTTPGGPSVDYQMLSNFAANERYAAYPARGDVLPVDGQDDISVLVDGFGAYLHYRDASGFELEVAVGPSLACFDVTTFPAIIRDPHTQAMRFPLMVRLASGSSVVTSFGSEDNVPSPLVKNWTTSGGASTTFCGRAVQMYYQNKTLTTDWAGTIEISPRNEPGSYFEWRKEDGTEPIWDSATGSQLISPVPPYPPR